MWAAAKRSWANGNVLIIGGGLCAAASGTMLFTADNEESLRQGIGDESSAFRRLSEMRRAANDASLSNEVTNAPVLYKASVKTALGGMFDGPVALRNLKKDQVVGVLEEGVGPKARYSLARSYDPNDKPLSQGW